MTHMPLVWGGSSPHQGVIHLMSVAHVWSTLRCPHGHLHTSVLLGCLVHLCCLPASVFILVCIQFPSASAHTAVNPSMRNSIPHLCPGAPACADSLEAGGVFTQVLTMPAMGCGASSATPSPRTVPKAMSSSTMPPPPSVPEKQKPARDDGGGSRPQTQQNFRVRSVLAWDHPHQASPVLRHPQFHQYPHQYLMASKGESARLCSQETLAQGL